MTLVAGIVALGLGLAGNRLIWRVFHGRGTAWLVPIWEESVKTGLGLLQGRVFAVHLLFGLGEAMLEAIRGQPLAGALALASHVSFGAVTYFVWHMTGLPAAGWFLGSCAHTVWNQAVLRLSSRSGNRPGSH